MIILLWLYYSKFEVTASYLSRSPLYIRSNHNLGRTICRRHVLCFREHLRTGFDY